MDLEVLSPLNILLITDKQNGQEVYQSFFQDKKMPFSIGGVSPIHKAIVFLSSTPFDMVIVDSYTDWMTVFELIQDFPVLPWFVLVDKGNEEIAVQAFKAGAADCILKESKTEYLPLLLDSIIHVIQQRDEKILTDQYHQQLEDIVADRTQVLMKSNQLLSEEVSQRAQAIEDLKESREIYRRFFETSRDAVFISSVDGRWIDMNQSALQLFGYQDREQIWNDSILDLYMDPGERKEYQKTINKQGFVKNFPLKFKKKDGKNFDALVSATPYEIGGKLIGYQGFIRDISDDIRAEEDKQSILKQQTVIDDLAIEMGTSLALEDIYNSIRIHVQDLFTMDGISLYKVDREQESIQAEYIWMNDKKAGIVDFTPARFDNLNPSLTTQVIQDKTGLNIANLQAFLQETNQESIKGNHPNESPTGKIQGLHFPYATLLAPIVVKEEVIGVLQVINQQPDVYSPDDLHILSRIAKVVAIGLQKAYLYQESLAHVKKLSSLQRIEQAILENLSLPTTLDILVDHLVRELAVDAVDILYFHPALKTLKFINQTGFRQNILQHTDLEIGEGLAGKAAETQNMVHVLDLTREDSGAVRSLEFSTENFVSYFGVPLMAKGRLVGVLEIFHRSRLDPEQDWIDLLKMVSGLAAIAIDHQNLFNDLNRSRNDIQKAFDAIIEGWAQALELRGIEAEGHWRRVEALTLRLAEKLGLKGEVLIDIRRGALLHDIGKMGIPDDVLLKETRLTTEERKLIGRHPIHAHELLKSIDGLQPALDIPLYHHERWDGEGYPYRIAGEEIPLSARIFSVVDVWDAMQADRPYRKAIARDEALNHLKKQAGKHFDPRVVKLFLEIIEEDNQKELKAYQNGDQVEAENGNTPIEIAS